MKKLLAFLLVFALFSGEAGAASLNHVSKIPYIEGDTASEVKPASSTEQRRELKAWVGDPRRIRKDADGNLILPENDGNTEIRVLGVPQLRFGEDQVLGTIRIQGKAGVAEPMPPGQRLMVLLPRGVAYTKVPTPGNLSQYVSVPEQVDGITNRLTPEDIELVESTPRSLTIAVRHIQEGTGQIAVDFLFNQPLSRVRLSPMVRWPEVGSGEPVSRQDFFRLLHEAVAGFSKEPSVWPLGDEAVLKRFADGERVSPANLGETAALVEAGVVNGYPDGMLRPDEPIRWAEAVALTGLFLARPDDEQMGNQEDAPAWVRESFYRLKKWQVLSSDSHPIDWEQPVTQREAFLLLEGLFASYSR